MERIMHGFVKTFPEFLEILFTIRHSPILYSNNSIHRSHSSRGIQEEISTDFLLENSAQIDCQQTFESLQWERNEYPLKSTPKLFSDASCCVRSSINQIGRNR